MGKRDGLALRRSILDAEEQKIRDDELERARQEQIDILTPLDQCHRLSGIPLELMDKRIQRHPPTGMMTGVEK